MTWFRFYIQVIDLHWGKIRHSWNHASVWKSMQLSRAPVFPSNFLGQMSIVLMTKGSTKVRVGNAQRKMYRRNPAMYLSITSAWFYFISLSLLVSFLALLWTHGILAPTLLLLCRQWPGNSRENNVNGSLTIRQYFVTHIPTILPLRANSTLQLNVTREVNV